MKTKIKLITLLAIVIALAITSCSKETDQPQAMNHGTVNNVNATPPKGGNPHTLAPVGQLKDMEPHPDYVDTDTETIHHCRAAVHPFCYYVDGGALYCIDIIDLSIGTNYNYLFEYAEVGTTDIKEVHYVSTDVAVSTDPADYQ